MGSEVIATQSDHFSSNTGITDEPVERFSMNTYPDSGGIVGPLQKTTDGDACINTSKCIYPADAKASLPKCFGCCICDIMFEIEKEFLEHCCDHGFSPPDDLFPDLF